MRLSTTFTPLKSCQVESSVEVCTRKSMFAPSTSDLRIDHPALQALVETVLSASV